MSHQEDGFNWQALDSVPAGQPQQIVVNHGNTQPARRVAPVQVSQPQQPTVQSQPFEIIDLDGSRQQVRENTWG